MENLIYALNLEQIMQGNIKKSNVGGATMKKNIFAISPNNYTLRCNKLNDELFGNAKEIAFFISGENAFFIIDPIQPHSLSTFSISKQSNNKGYAIYSKNFVDSLAKIYGKTETFRMEISPFNINKFGVIYQLKLQS